ncbi:hypothetical protein HanPSC8_Chr05g0199181 [Helianthus annuus]|nr:hypothetical protein HanPSC8_Chr05g0199181 [Helianthus annuus]
MLEIIEPLFHSWTCYLLLRSVSKHTLDLVTTTLSYFVYKRKKMHCF